MKKNWFTKQLAVAGTILAGLPIAAPIIFAILSLVMDGRFRFDYLMPAELFFLVIRRRSIVNLGSYQGTFSIKDDRLEPGSRDCAVFWKPGTCHDHRAGRRKGRRGEPVVHCTNQHAHSVHFGNGIPIHRRGITMQVYLSIQNLQRT